jgi:transposase
LELLHKEVLSGKTIGADESPMQVIKEPNRSATSQSYMWTFRGGTEDKPAIQFVYAPTRSAEVAKEYLRGYKGAVQTDGYVGYDFLDDIEGIVHLGCMAHARRKFVDVLKALGKDWKKKLRGVAGETLLTIRELYAVEREAKSHQMTDTERQALRQIKAKPLMKAMHDSLMKAQATALPSSKLGEAIGYTLSQWSRLERYLEAGHYRIDNNLVENEFRVFAVGRKNWLFCYSQDGARASACFYTLILTAKANGLDPFWYLNAIFERLPYAESEQDYRALLPQHIDKQLLVPERG